MCALDTVYLSPNFLSTCLFPASIREISHKMCWMPDSSDICGAQFLYASHSLHLTTLCAQFHIVIYSWSPQNLPDSSSSSPTSCLIPLLLFNWQPREKKASRREKVSGPNYGRGPRLFAFGRSCQSLQLCSVVELVLAAEELLCSCQSGGLMLLLRGNECRGRGQQSSVRRPPGCFK